MIIRLLILFFVLLSTIFPENGIPNGKSYEYFMNAEYERLNENYASALSKYNYILRKHQHSTTLHKTVAEIYFHQGKNSKAQNHLKKAFDLDKNDIETGIMLFQLYISQEDSTIASNILDTLLYHNPEKVELLYYQAEFQFKQHDWRGLLSTYKNLFILDNKNTELFQKILEIGKVFDDPNILENVLEEILSHDEENYFILQALAQHHYTQGNLESAVTYFIKMIPFAEEKLVVELTVADIYLRINQPEIALQYLEPLANSENTTFDIFHLLLIAYTTTNNTSKQIEIGKEMVELYPEHQTGFETLAYVYLENEDYIKALEILDNAVHRFPERSLFPYLTGSIHRIHKSYNDAKQYFSKALELSSESRTIRYALATVTEELLEFSTTDSLFELIISDDENDVGALNDYAYMISERPTISSEQMDYALLLAKKAVEQSPENPAFLDTIGWIFYRLNDFKNAKKYIQKSIELDSQNTVILEHYGDVLVKIDDLVTAKIIYKKALEIDSNNLILHDKIEQLKDE